MRDIGIGRGVCPMVALCGVLVGCGGSGVGQPDAQADAGPGRDDAPGSAVSTCPAIYAQDVLPTFEIELTDEVWAALRDDYVNWEQRTRDGLPIKPYHPIATFRYQHEVVTDAMIRLKGNPCCSWDQDKMQFVISFNRNDRDRRFRGLRKLDLDAPSYDPTYLRNRVALAYLRDLGLPASCANNARLVINGSYYGLYGNLERVDREFLERNFSDPDGDLYKHGEQLKTNEDESTGERAELFWDTTDPDALAGFVDVEQMVTAWAAEVVIPQADGYWAGSNNFYLYDHPDRGFVFIPHDLDDSFDDLAHDFDPFDLPGGGSEREHFDALMADPTWRDVFVARLADAHAGYDVDELRARTDAWARQIERAAVDDPSRPFDLDEHDDGLEVMRAYYGQRAGFLDDWLACQRTDAPDADGDGYGWCRECDDGAATSYPGAPELCNGVDDDCNGVVDDDPGDTCPDCATFARGSENFLICTRPRTFADARARCASHGAEVAVPRDAGEDQFLFDSAQSLDDYLKLWIGITDDAREDAWTTLSGEPLRYVNFEPDQPSGGDYANCAVIHPDHDGQWNDKSCDDQYAVACRVVP